MIDLPIRLFVEQIPPAQIAGVLARQLAWTAGLIILGRIVIRRATRRLVVQGG